MATTLLDLINFANVEDGENEHRNHLGGSLIGRKCKRALWYTFRWAARDKFEGRMLRLFLRGHREEYEFVRHLRRVGVQVREYSERLVYSAFDAVEIGIEAAYLTLAWDTNIPTGFEDVTGNPEHIKAAEKLGVKVKQWRVLDVQGHFGGSLDGIGNADFPIVDEWGGTIPAGEEALLEFKTHNTKSFQNLKALKVKEAKPDHWNQMQIYMFKKQLRHALYMAVNKNDDDIFIEVVTADYTIGAELIEKARLIIHAKQPPHRISSNPSFFDCKYCTHYRVCHYAEPMEISCRSCAFATPVDDGQWHCGKWNSIIPSDYISKACKEYNPIRD